MKETAEWSNFNTNSVACNAIKYMHMKGLEDSWPTNVIIPMPHVFNHDIDVLLAKQHKSDLFWGFILEQDSGIGTLYVNQSAEAVGEKLVCVTEAPNIVKFPEHKVIMRIRAYSHAIMFS